MDSLRCWTELSIVNSIASNVTELCYDQVSGEMLSEYSGHINRDYRLDCCLDHSDKYVLSGSENGQVYIWSLVEGGLVAKLDHGAGKYILCHLVVKGEVMWHNLIPKPTQV